MQLLDGKSLSKQLNATLKEAVDTLSFYRQRVPHLVVILVGDNGASQTYVKSKIKSCEEVGFKSTLIKLTSQIGQQDLVECISELNQDPAVDGILVQLPLPNHIDQHAIINAIDPGKDVDGFHPTNVGKLALNSKNTFVPATPYGILLLLSHYKIQTEGKHIVVIGRSNIVGRPLSILLSQQRDFGNATVTLCHNKTQNLKEITLQADIIIVAVGIPGFITGDMVKQGVTVIDVGITRVEDATKSSGYRIAGDVDFDSVAPKCDFITPVPGGVGPMTIAALLRNTYQAYAFTD